MRGAKVCRFRQILHDEGELPVVVARVQCIHRPCQAAVQRLDALDPGRQRFHQDTPAVVGVARAAHIAAPLEPVKQPDILPIMLEAATQVSKDRDADGPGGTVEVPQERKARLPKLKAAHRVLGLQIAAD